MTRVRCTAPGCRFDTYTQADPTKVLTSHRARWHGGQEFADAVHQLDGVSWQEQALDAIRTLAATGQEFTLADLHGKIPDPPHHSHWGSVTRVAAHMGLIVECGRVESSLATTNRSLVRRWRGASAVAS